MNIKFNYILPVFFLTIFSFLFLNSKTLLASDYSCSVQTTRCNPGSEGGTIDGGESSASCSCADDEVGVCGASYGACRDGNEQPVEHDPPYDPPYKLGALQYIVDSASCNCYHQSPDTCSNLGDLCYGETSCCGDGSGGPYCGDGSCNNGETASSCPGDCNAVVGQCGTNAGVFTSQQQAFTPPPFAPYTLCSAGNPSTVTGGNYNTGGDWTWRCNNTVCAAPSRAFKMTITGPTSVAVNTNYEFRLKLQNLSTSDLSYRYITGGSPTGGTISPVTGSPPPVDPYTLFQYYFIGKKGWGSDMVEVKFNGNSGSTPGSYNLNFRTWTGYGYYDTNDTVPLTVVAPVGIPTPDLKVTVYDQSGTGFSNPWIYQNSDGPIEIFYGANYVLSWGAVSGATCTLDGVSVSASGGSKQYSSASAPSTNHILSCTNSGGTGTDTVNVKVPPIPTNFTSSCDSSGTSMTVVWNLPAGYSQSYFRAKAGSATWPPDVISPLYAGNSYTFTTVPGQLYYIWAHTGIGNGAYSNAVIATKTCSGPPPATVDISSANAACLPSPNTGTTLTWTYSNASSCTITPPGFFVGYPSQGIGAFDLQDFAPHNMTSDNSATPFISSASTAASHWIWGTWGGFKAFDGKPSNEEWKGTNSGVDWLSLDIGAGNTRKLAKYKIQAPYKWYEPDNSRAPKAWTMEGSNDNVNWTVLDTRTNQITWADNEVREYVLSTPSASYRYFRLNISSNNGNPETDVAELFLYGSAGGTSGNGMVFPVNMTLDNTPSPIIASASNEQHAVCDYDAYRAFDGDLPQPTCGNWWVGTSDGASWWLKLDLGQPNKIAVKSYSMSESAAWGDQYPKTWTLQGSNDNSSWTTIDTRSNVTWTNSYTPESQTFTSNGSNAQFRYIRLNVTVNGGNSFTRILEMKLYSENFTGGGSAPTGPISFPGKNYTITCDPGNVNDTVNVCVAQVTTYSLTVTKSGQGTVTSAPAGIDCGSTCTAQYDQNTVVSLTATPQSGRVFNGWSGACSGRGACTVLIDSAKTVNANFASNPDFREF